MPVDVRSKVYRILRAIPSFTQCERWSDAVHLAPHRPPFGPEELILGYYQNQPDSIDETVLFTDRGLHIREKQAWVATRYAAIADAHWLGSEKLEGAGIELLLESGEKLTMPIRGGNGRFRDVFEVLRFIDRVTDHRNKPS